jgi:MinD-like ATPase involved in chromosome partitioning or flagellar assembly
MSDQASKLRELADSALPGAPAQSVGIPMIAVTGSRAGVGTTTVAINLAAVLSDRGEHVVLVDAAEERANLAQVAGTEADHQRGIEDVMAGTCGVAAALVAGPAGTMVLAARSRVSAIEDSPWRRRALEFSPGRISDRRISPTRENSRRTQQRLLTGLQSLNELASVIVIDTGTGFSPWAQRFWLRARLAVLVTTVDDAALVDTYAVLKRSAADDIETDVRVLANQCDSDAVARAACSRLSTACQRFLSRSLQTLPPLPLHRVDRRFGACTLPRVWECPNTSFGRAALWLGQSVSAVLPCADPAEARARTRRYRQEQPLSC